MIERGVKVNHTTIYRWVQSYCPEIDKRAKPYFKPTNDSWRVDETYVKVKGKWKYLYRAIDKHGRLIDFFLSDRRNAKAAKRFLGKALRTRKDWPPLKINTDKNDAYPPAIQELKQQGKLAPDVEHRQVKYLNNRLEAEHGGLKRLIIERCIN